MHGPPPRDNSIASVTSLSSVPSTSSSSSSSYCTANTSFTSSPSSSAYFTANTSFSSSPSSSAYFTANISSTSSSSSSYFTPNTSFEDPGSQERSSHCLLENGQIRRVLSVNSPENMERRRHITLHGITERELENLLKLRDLYGDEADKDFDMDVDSEPESSCEEPDDNSKEEDKDPIIDGTPTIYIRADTELADHRDTVPPMTGPSNRTYRYRNDHLFGKLSRSLDTMRHREPKTGTALAKTADGCSPSYGEPFETSSTTSAY
ncbi:hypothetical protein C0991_001003 [Blastosporella zonata]|nr:hypothetical protein C0991_001003 [Blastosporella zonata]